MIWQMRSLLAVLACCLAAHAAAEKSYPLFYPSAAPFKTAIAETKQIKPLTVHVTGVTVPHHLLAAEMIAHTLRLAAGTQPARIILLTPDHFSRSERPFATSVRDFATPLGPVATDLDAVKQLLKCPLVEKSNLFSHEHGAQALLPFLAKLFPGVPVLPVALGVRSSRAEWETLAAALAPLVAENTLLVQSTDFSHYLSAKVARQKDQETLRAIASGDAAAILALNQPDHLDSKAAQWLMTTLQQRRHHATATVVDNRNAIDFGGPPDEPRTTSYITQVWSPDRIPAEGLPGEAWFFGGDTHFGRHLAPLLADPAAVARVDRAILGLTGGRPLIVNLEGVMLDQVPPAAHPMKIGMAERTTLDRLKAWHTRGVILANNHTLDFGPASLAAMRHALETAGITCVGDRECVDFGPFRLAAATDWLNPPAAARNRITADMVASWRDTPPPWIAFFHCGKEYGEDPGARERLLGERAGAAGAGLLLGCHPHRPSPGWELGGGALRFYSLGNLLFDQSDVRNTGGLVEVRFFKQGTWTARWLPLGNLYHILHSP
jgi:poly-gamma-glutamate synthesis protein (capsule biosynthesis protein)